MQDIPGFTTAEVFVRQTYSYIGDCGDAVEDRERVPVPRGTTLLFWGGKA